MTSIKDVLLELESIISNCRENKSRQGYFAALYHAMTESVKNNLEGGYFDNATRMEKLDVLFAKRYVVAWHNYNQGLPCSESWKAAFKACENSSLVVLQHLLLGINAHINLDLCIAAAETCPGDSIDSLKNDFEKINNLIATLTDTVQKRLETIWWPMKFLDSVVNRQEKAVIGFSINNARKASWSNAVILANLSSQATTNYELVIDKTVNNIANKIINPGFFTNLLLKPVRWFEYKDIVKIMTVLNQPLVADT